MGLSNVANTAGLPMRDTLKTHLLRSFELTRDLVAHLDESALGLDLPGLPSNRIAGQLWCIVGARESYAQAIERGAWSGFACTLDAPRVKSSVLAALDAASRHFEQIEFASLSKAQLDLAFDLLEHEVQHHGQLIRFVYAHGANAEAGARGTVRLTFPPSWRERYHV